MQCIRYVVGQCTDQKAAVFFFEVEVLTFEQSASWIFLLTSPHTADEDLLSGALGSNFGCGNDAIILSRATGAARGLRLLRHGARHRHGGSVQRTR